MGTMEFVVCPRCKSGEGVYYSRTLQIDEDRTDELWQCDNCASSHGVPYEFIARYVLVFSETIEIGQEDLPLMSHRDPLPLSHEELLAEAKRVAGLLSPEQLDEHIAWVSRQLKKLKEE